MTGEVALRTRSTCAWGAYAEAVLALGLYGRSAPRSGWAGSSAARKRPGARLSGLHGRSVARRNACEARGRGVRRGALARA
eukprot:4759909-Alexandrium_andersonii.AAC.1